MRLLRWTAGLLPAPHDEWGRAMVGELDHIEGRGRRWRFTIGCVGATLLLPPRGRAGAGVLAIVAVAVGSLGLYASVVMRYRLGAGDWVGVAIALTFLLSFVLAANLLLRRPGVAVPGLLGGLFVALAWLAISGFTFSSFLAPLDPGWTILLLLIVVPAIVGAAGTLWSGNAVLGRRTARLAGISAGVGLFLYGTLAGRGARCRRTARRFGLYRPLHRQRPARQQHHLRSRAGSLGHRDDGMGRRGRHRPHPAATRHQRGYHANHDGRSRGADDKAGNGAISGAGSRPARNRTCRAAVRGTGSGRARGCRQLVEGLRSLHRVDAPGDGSNSREPAKLG